MISPYLTCKNAAIMLSLDGAEKHTFTSSLRIRRGIDQTTKKQHRLVHTVNKWAWFSAHLNNAQFPSNIVRNYLSLPFRLIPGIFLWCTNGVGFTIISFFLIFYPSLVSLVIKIDGSLGRVSRQTVDRCRWWWTEDRGPPTKMLRNLAAIIYILLSSTWMNDLLRNSAGFYWSST